MNDQIQHTKHIRHTYLHNAHTVMGSRRYFFLFRPENEICKIEKHNVRCNKFEFTNTNWNALAAAAACSLESSIF